MSEISKNADVKKYSQPSIDRLRFLLMPFMFILLLGFPSRYGDAVQKMCGFVPVAYFILSGFLVLRRSEQRSQRILRTIKRTAIVFAALAAAYFVMNLVYYRINGSNVFDALKSKRFWFDFIVMNVWDLKIGTSIWFVQSMLYAYIIIYFMDKLKLLRYDWIFFILLIIFTVATGELTGIVKFTFLGYDHIPGNFLTRALPYLLLGGFLSKHMDFFDSIPRLFYWIALAISMVFAYIEMSLLSLFDIPGYYGHVIWLSIAAFMLCVITVKDRSSFSVFESRLLFSRWNTALLYYICQPMAFLLLVVISKISKPLLVEISIYIGLITYALCIVITSLTALIRSLYIDAKIRKQIRQERRARHHHAHEKVTDASEKE